MDYSKELCTELSNPNCHFYKLIIDGKCYYDDWIKKVEKVKVDYDTLGNLLAWMDTYDPKFQYPKTKFNHINGIKRKDVFEFKKKNLRIYVIKQEPNVYIICGGYKNSQGSDIENINHRTRQLPAEI